MKSKSWNRIHLMKYHLKTKQKRTPISGTVCCANSLQLWLTLCDPMDCSLLGSSLHWILQVRLLEWVAMPFSRGSPQSRDWTCIFSSICMSGRLFPIWATRDAPSPHLLGLAYFQQHLEWNITHLYATSGFVSFAITMTFLSTEILIHFM